VSGLAKEIGDDPVLFADLYGFDTQAEQFAAAESASDQHGENRVIPLAPEGIAVRGGQQEPLALLGGEPVPDADSNPAHSFDSPDPGRKFRTQKLELDKLDRMRRLALAIVACVPAFVQAAEPRQLFNGKDLSGWEMVGYGRFVVEDGMLKTEGGMGLLYYAREKFGNQTIRAVFKAASPKANSGVYIRMPEPPPDAWYGVHNGFEVQIDSAGDEWHRTGAIYSLSRSTKLAQKPQGEWNTMDIELDGAITRVRLNGELVNEFDPSKPVPPRKQHYEPVRGPRPEYGYIGLQNHDPDSIVYFKEVSVLETAKTIDKGERDRIVSYFHSTRKQVLDQVSGVTDAQWNFHPADGKWSIAEVVEHLTLTEPGLFSMALSGLKNSAGNPGASKIKDEELIARMTDRSHPAEAPEMFKPSGKWATREALVDEFKARRDRSIEWLRQSRNDLRGNFVKFGPGAVDVYQMLLAIPAHTERHLQQIAEVKASPGYPK
jgi:Domain of Unknown Function (DUF1080)/DinB superfamily